MLLGTASWFKFSSLAGWGAPHAGHPRGFVLKCSTLPPKKSEQQMGFAWKNTWWWGWIYHQFRLGLLRKFPVNQLELLQNQLQQDMFLLTTLRVSFLFLFGYLWVGCFWWPMTLALRSCIFLTSEWKLCIIKHQRVCVVHQLGFDFTAFPLLSTSWRFAAGRAFIWSEIQSVPW